ncbi:MAG: tetratricopeptide repeat protein [Acidobacteriota bacterium]|nr:tetratricopeptide repeat protein [Acidobacteriota bacterium]
MKRCPQCNRVETDNALVFCRVDGAALVSDSGAVSADSGTVKFGAAPVVNEIETSILPHRTDADLSRPTAPTTVLPAQSTPGTTRELSRSKRSKTVAVIAGLIAIVVAGSAYFYLTYKKTRAIESIAVMPFVNESGNADVEYLSDGMTETLISSLSQLPNLSVKGRSSVFRYKGKEADAKAVGKDLGVQAVLYGRVVQRGDQLTLSVELLDALTENVIWSDKYDRKQADLVALQSEIARDVPSKLKTKFSGTDEAKVTKNYTDNTEAYQLHLKGRFYWNKRTGESLKQAVEYFNQAVAKDPNYALAYSGLAESYVLFPNYSVALPLECMPKAKAAAVRALEIDDSLAEAHTALAIYHSNFSWNQPAAEKEFRRAIELNPNYPNAHHQFGVEFLVAMGRFDEAIAEGRRAEQLDPFSPVIGADLGTIFGRARRFDEAIAQLNRVLTVDPNFHVTHYYLGIIYHAKGNYAEAVAEYRKALALNADPWVKAQLARSLARLGQRDEATKLLGELQSASARRYVSSASLALVYGALGDKDKAFAWLEKEVAERTPRSTMLSVNPIWDDLRDDSRFADLVRRVASTKMD